VAGRIVLFGATGYTGELTARALARRDARPVLAGRNRERLGRLAEELGGLETAVADVAAPATVRSLVEAGDVLVSTVGPFARWGEPAVRAAIDARASYLDSTGEPAFIRRVFEEFGPKADRGGTGLVTAFGYDFVPGNLAGALALRDAGEQTRRVDVGYFTTGGGLGGFSGGTRASAAGALIEPGFVWRDRIRTERGAARVRSFELDGRKRPAMSIGSSEHFALPRLQPRLKEVNAYLGWFGRATRAMQAFSMASAPLLRLPGARSGTRRVVRRFVQGSTGGPGEEERAGTGSEIVAIAYGPDAQPLAEVRVAGANGYEFTADILAWGATRCAESGLHGTGALGPAEAFGLEQLEAGCSEAGLDTIPRL
jgi:short subunit dehydrogenase-like uncharacterized protein